MPQTLTFKNAQDYRLGICKITRNGTDIGRTIGNVVLHVEKEWLPIQPDGAPSPMDYVLKSILCTLQVPLGENTFAALQLAFPEASTSGTGIKENAYVGQRLRGTKGDWKVFPVENTDPDISGGYVNIPNGVVLNVEDYEYGDDLRGYNITVTALYDPSSDKIFSIDV